MAGPCGSPLNVDGATTSGFRAMRLTFHAASNDRMNAWSPSTAMVTGVPTGVPSRRKLVQQYGALLDERFEHLGPCRRLHGSYLLRRTSKRVTTALAVL